MGSIPWLYKYLDDTYHIDKQFRYATRDVPILGDFYKAIDNWNYANDYLNNRNLSWMDVKYPTKAFGGSGGVYGAVQPTLKSLEDLYKSDERKYDKNLRRHALQTSIEANNMRRAWYYSRM